MNEAVKPHAKLVDAHWSDWREGSLAGRIYGDQKKRFADGEHVVTSPATLLEGQIYKTRSGTLYEVEFRPDAKATS